MTRLAVCIRITAIRAFHHMVYDLRYSHITVYDQLRSAETLDSRQSQRLPTVSVKYSLSGHTIIQVAGCRTNGFVQSLAIELRPATIINDHLRSVAVMKKITSDLTDDLFKTVSDYNIPIAISDDLRLSATTSRS